MKRLLSLALCATSGLVILSTGAPAAQRLSAYMCQPLNAGNRQRCCEAANWRDIVLLWQQNQCERIRDKRSQQAGTIGNRGTNSGDDTQTGDNTPTTPGPGNPGNDKPVGHAGEHVSQGMMADGVGVHGASENHNHK